MRSFVARSFNNCPMMKLVSKTTTIALNVAKLVKSVVRITVIKAAIPKLSFDLCHKTIPGMVAKKHNTYPIKGTKYVTKATIIKVITPSIVALGLTLENKFATPILNLTIMPILTSLKGLYNYCQLRHERVSPISCIPILRLSYMS